MTWSVTLHTLVPRHVKNRQPYPSEDPRDSTRAAPKSFPKKHGESSRQREAIRRPSEDHVDSEGRDEFDRHGESSGNDVNECDERNKHEREREFLSRGISDLSDGLSREISHRMLRPRSERITELVCSWTLYGLKQSPRMWIYDFLVSTQCLTRLNADHSIYIQRTSTLSIIAL